MKLVQALAIALGVIAITSMSISFANVQGQILTLQQQPQIETLADNFLSLNISFANNTNATLDRESITEEQGNTIVAAINFILLNDDESLEDLELLEEEEPEIEEEEVEESDDDGGGNGNDNDNGNDGNDNDDNEVEEPESPIETILPGIDDDEPVGGAEEELELELKQDPCGAAYPAMVGAGPPPECREKYLEAIEKARQTPPSDLSKE